MKKKNYTIPQTESFRLTTSYMIMEGISGGTGSGSAGDPNAPEAPMRFIGNPQGYVY